MLQALRWKDWRGGGESLNKKVLQKVLLDPKILFKVSLVVFSQKVVSKAWVTRLMF